MKHIAIFASGSGSNAQKILEYFEQSDEIRVGLIVSNRAQAGVLNVARAFEVPTRVIDRANFYDSTDILTVLQEYQIDYVVLAGFLWLVPAYLVQAYPRRILNIHPALLPKYGGKGMYGHHVHQAVQAAGETESGPSIHFVNEHYDEGDLIFQATCAINATDSAAEIALKVLALEHQHYPRIIEQVVLQDD